MVSRSTQVGWHGLMVVAALALALWAGGARAAARYEGYDTATPYSPPLNKYKYIPLHSSYAGFEPQEEMGTTEEADTTNSGVPPSEFILKALRTALDVVRKINQKRVNTSASRGASNTTAIGVRKSLKAKNGTSVETGRGFEDYYDEHHPHETTTTTAKPMKQGRYTDPWAGYYDWIINEGSFKFWSVFQLFTAALLLYACFSAIYYAKFNPIIPDYSLEYDDYFLERTVGRKARSLESSELPSGLSWINPKTFQFILDAISKHYEDK